MFEMKITFPPGARRIGQVWHCHHTSRATKRGQPVSTATLIHTQQARSRGDFRRHRTRSPQQLNGLTNELTSRVCKKYVHILSLRYAPR